MNFEVFTGSNSELYFRLVDNGKTILTSEGYKQKDSALNGIESVKKNLRLPTGVEMKESTNGKHFFNIKSTNGQVVGTSALFDSVELRDKWLTDMKNDIPMMKVIEIEK